MGGGALGTGLEQDVDQEGKTGTKEKNYKLDSMFKVLLLYLRTQAMLFFHANTPS